jgi:putative membrane-bound dehydrogenase-like protein
MLRRLICSYLWAAAVTLAALGSLAAAAKPTHNLVTFKRQKLSDRFFAEGATFGDLNNDKHADLIAGPFWFEGPTFEKQHTYYPPKPFDPHGYSDNFFAYVEDFNADGWNDILIYGFPGQDASWFQNPKKNDAEWKRHVVIEKVDNESPTWTDLTGDGKPEVVCSVGGYFGYARPDESQPEKPWVFHRISDQTAGAHFTHGLGVGDVNGDGRMDLLEKSGWWEQPTSLDGDPIWKKHAVTFSGPGGAQMYAYDVDGDKLNDVITSLQAHGVGLVWYKQLKSDDGTQFESHTITGATAADSPYGVTFSEIHAIDLVDMDGDGLKDIVTGKRYWAHGPKGDPNGDAPAVIYWFGLVRGKDGEVDWVPHLIDDDSGVGVQVVAGDFSGDGKPDVVVANKKGIFAHTQVAKEVSKEVWEQNQPPRRTKTADGLSGEEAARAMSLPPGFRVDLCAAEPDVCQPIAMAFDDRGRLWVAEAYGYPNRLPDDQARDRILIFEDTDGDNKFDKRTVFVEGLNLVSGLELGFGGVWVGAAPYLLFIPDKDGDDRPDSKPQVLLDGWGYEDTHETLNAFNWGPDGWLYGCHGVFTHSNVGKPGATEKERKRINAGIWRYHPTRHEFEIFAEGTSNPWGVDFNDRGHAFCTACVIPHLYHVIQGAHYQRQAGQHFNQFVFDDIKTIAKHRHWVGSQWSDADRAKSDSIGGGHAHAGAMLYLGGAWPERYRNQLFMHNIHGARVNQDKLARDGSGYVGDAAPDFCFANDIWSQMISLAYGPDGQVTMIDWYDRNQCHHKNTEGHDRGNGRIFKISYGDAKPVQVDLKKLTDAQLIEHLQNTNQWYARHARRILQERATDKALASDTSKQLQSLLNNDQPPAARLLALWTLHAAAALSAEDYRELLSDKNEDIRSWAVQFATENEVPSAETLATFAKMASDDGSPLVRLYLASALQRLPLADRWSIASGLTQHAEDADDHNLPLMIWYGVEPLVMADTSRAMQLAGNSKISLVARYVARRAAADPAGYDALLAQLSNADESTQLWMLDEIVSALKVRANQDMPKAWSSAFDKLIASKNETIRQQAEYVAVKFGDQRVLPKLRSTLIDRKLPLERRKLALDSLLVAKDRELPAILHSLLDDADLRNAAISGLASFDDSATPEILIKAYDKLPAAEQQAAIATLTSRVPYILALLDAIEAKRIPRTDLTAFTVRQLARLEDKRVNERLTDVWGTIRQTSADKATEVERYRKLLKPEVLKLADLQHGRQVFTKTCGTCHSLFSAGKNIGPDLTGSNRANLDYVLENVLDPSAVVGKDYQMTVVLTDEGRSLSGILKNETDSAITLQTPTDVVTLPKSEIEERKLSPLSLMPDGQLKEMKPDEARDLIAYLASPIQVPLPGEGPWRNPATGKIAGAIEGETLKVQAKTGGATGSQGMLGFPLGKWSGDSQMWWTGAKPGDTLSVEVPVENDGTYEVFVGMTKAVDYGIVSLAMNDTKPTQPINLFNATVVNTQPASLGVHKLKAGKNRLTIKIEGADPQAVKAHMFGLDYVSLAPQTNE